MFLPFIWWMQDVVVSHTLKLLMYSFLDILMLLLIQFIRLISVQCDLVIYKYICIRHRTRPQKTATTIENGTCHEYVTTSNDTQFLYQLKSENVLWKCTTSAGSVAMPYTALPAPIRFALLSSFLSHYSVFV